MAALATLGAGCYESGQCRFMGIGVHNSSPEPVIVHVVVEDATRMWLDATADLAAYDRSGPRTDNYAPPGRFYEVRLPPGTYRFVATAGNLTRQDTLAVTSDVSQMGFTVMPRDGEGWPGPVTLTAYVSPCGQP